jgi:3'-5' exoribonuclease
MPFAVHRDISALDAGDVIDEFFLCRDAALKTARNGSFYVEAELMDRTGGVKGRQWDARPEDLGNYPAGCVVKIKASVERYQGALQFKLHQSRAAHESEYTLADLLPASSADPASLEKEFKSKIAAIANPRLRALLEAVFGDQEFWDRFRNSPAAEALHHPFLHGLLEHTVTSLRAADAFSSVNPRVDRDMLLTGVMLHDLGKADELSVEGGFHYTDEGMLLGHISLGAMRVDRVIRGLPEFPAELRLRVLHIILSHHGKREFGSPVLPATPEAVAVHELENLDARLEAAERLIRRHPVPEEHWTDWNRMFEGKLFRGTAPM